ncbi:MAG TPA: FAD-dependent oxidoreductase [Chitinophagaceae bacterium]|nr:FAD-dependent oxidoreductase [Chitinophagaceae bacterium]
MAPLPWQKGIVRHILQETHNTRRFFIQLPDLERFDFQAGQFVTLDLPIHERPGRRWRSYSIASWPDGTNVFELVIVKMEGGAGTNYLFNEVQEGTEISVRGPQGVFVLPDPMDKDLFLICTGTGIAPFRSMLHYINKHNPPHRNIYLIFGTRRRENLLYHEDLLALQEKIPYFHYLPTLSREEWEGRTGYVHAVYEELAKTRQPADFMLCGWKDMIDEARKRIQDMGYPKSAIHLESYG